MSQPQIFLSLNVEGFKTLRKLQWKKKKKKKKEEIPEGECVVVKTRTQFELQVATCLHEVGIASNRLHEGRNEKNKRKKRKRFRKRKMEKEKIQGERVIEKTQEIEDSSEH